MKHSIPLRLIADRMFGDLPDDNLHHEARAIAGYVGSLSTAIENLERLAEIRDPMMTEAGHAKRVAAAASQLQKRIEAVNESIHEMGVGAARRLGDLIDTTTGLKPNDFAQEIRASVRAMKPEERMKILAEAVRSGDAPTVAALTDAPSVVTGLDPERAARMRQSYVEQHAATEWAAATRLSTTISTAATAIATARKAAVEAASPRYIAEVDQQAARAAAAQTAFNESLAG